MREARERSGGRVGKTLARPGQSGTIPCPVRACGSPQAAVPVRGREAMTEAEWADCQDPRRMLDYHRMKKDPRRLRLLAAECVRRVLPADAEELFGQVLEVVERY